MDRRRRSVEDTRRRIVAATVQLHAERGILGTSWKDIAERADVSVATVYKHFPSLDELVPACGEMVERLSAPPELSAAAGAFAGVGGVEERLAVLVGTFYDFYERGEPYLEVDARERQLTMVREWEAHLRVTRDGYVREALGRSRGKAEAVRVISALLDFAVYKSFRRAGVSKEAAAAAVHRMLACWLAGAGS